MKKTVAFLVALIIMALPVTAADTQMESEPQEDVPASVFEEDSVPVSLTAADISAPSAILIEKTSGTVIFEKNADDILEPASVTKVMTILLIAEAVDSGELDLDETVTVSAYAAGMGGSQVFLEEGEQMTAGEMLKCIVVSSANDAAVAMAEHLAGSEQGFVSRMNERAAQLGMNNTHFGNCTGLLKDPSHVTTARDISIMARELILHDWIKQYTTIWTDTIRDGTFGLSNTNKLIRFYNGATGLKTGYTSSAGHCLAATAQRDGVEFIAVVLNCSSSADRFESAKTLLSYGFSGYTVLDAVPDKVLPPVKVTLGKSGYVLPVLSETGTVLVPKSGASSVSRTVTLSDELPAPVSEGQVIGSFVMTLDGRELYRADITAAASVERLTLWDLILMSLKAYICG